MLSEDTRASVALDVAYAAAERHRLTHGAPCPVCGELCSPDDPDGVCPDCDDRFGAAGAMYGVDCPVCGGEDWVIVADRGRVLAVCPEYEEAGLGVAVALAVVR